jgi:hypothetical protein
MPGGGGAAFTPRGTSWQCSGPVQRRSLVDAIHCARGGGGVPLRAGRGAPPAAGANTCVDA